MPKKSKKDIEKEKEELKRLEDFVKKQSKPAPVPKPDEQSDEEEIPYDRKKVKVIKEIKKENKSGWLDYLEILQEGDDEPSMDSVSEKIQERSYKNLINKESNFIKRIQKNEKGKGSAKEQKERRIKNLNILRGTREEIRNKPNIRKLFNDLNPEIMKELKKQIKVDDEKEEKEKKEKQSKDDKFILDNIKFFEDELKEVKKRQQNPSTKSMIEELEERISDEKSKLSKN